MIDILSSILEYDIYSNFILEKQRWKNITCFWSIISSEYSYFLFLQ